MDQVQDAPAWPGDQHLDRDDWAAIEQLRAERDGLTGAARAANFAQVRRIRCAEKRSAVFQRLVEQGGVAPGASSIHAGAAAILGRTEDELLRWPWKALDDLMGAMGAGEVVYCVGFSGTGKSSFIRSAILEWAARGVAVDVLPLEEEPETFALRLACQSLGIDPGPVLAGGLNRSDTGETDRARIAAQLSKMGRDLFWRDDMRAFANPLRVDAAPGLTVDRLTASCEIAASRGARAIVVDHVDFLGEGGGKRYDTSRAVQQAALRLGKQHGLVMLLMSQANLDTVRSSPDHLAKYGIMRDTAVYMGLDKRFVASSMLTLYRPLRQPHYGESSEAYASAIKQARAGTVPPSDVLLPGAVGVSALKSRAYGNDGARCLLGWKRGSVVDYEGVPYSLR